MHTKVSEFFYITILNRIVSGINRFEFSLLISVIADIADDYIHVSATLSSISADDSTANKK